jgi:hypothetical protein
MNEEYKLEYLEIIFTCKTALFSKVEPETPHKSKPRKHKSEP